MILIYHHVKILSRSDISVGFFRFIAHMQQLRSKKVVYLDDYDSENAEHVVVAFDDGNRNVLTRAVPVLRRFGYPFEVFVVADFIEKAEAGKKNWLDRKDLRLVVEYGGRLQYHTKSHPRLDLIADARELENEIIVSQSLKALDGKGFRWFAYPYWRWNEQIVDIVKKHYVGARSGNGFEEATNIHAIGSVKMNDRVDLGDILCNRKPFADSSSARSR